MFHYLPIFYFAANLYVLLRIRSLFSNKQCKRYFLISYAILMCAFPITEIFSHSAVSGRIPWLYEFGYLSLPYMFYVFLLVILSDVTLIVIRMSRIIPASFSRGNGFRRVLKVTILVVPLFILTIGIVRHGDLRVSSYNISVPKKSSQLSSLRLVFAADLHLKGTVDENITRNFASKVNALSPDILLFVGDILEGDRSDARMQQIESILKKIDSKYGIYAALGNHETHVDSRDSFDFYSNSGITVLQDSYVNIEKAFYLIGRSDSRLEKRKTIGQLLANVSNDLPVIVMDHKPSDFAAVSNNNVDVQLSGHTHNGQLFPLNFVTSRMYDLSWGYKEIKNTHFFVTSGVQSWGPAVKTVGSSEIVLINIRFV